LINIKELKQLSKHLTLLYVEDDSDIRQETYELLKHFFHSISVAVDGKEGLEIYKNNFLDTRKYHDIVLSDIQMPNLNGVELSRAIQKINSQQKIIIISAHSDKKNLIELINLGIHSFIEKPFNHDHLFSMLYKVCCLLRADSILNLSNEIQYDRGCKKLMTSEQEEIALSDNELKLLELFTNHNNQTFSTVEIFNHLYYDKPEKEFSEDSIKSLIKRFRKKLPKNTILNNRQLGYYINMTIS